MPRNLKYKNFASNVHIPIVDNQIFDKSDEMKANNSFRFPF
jgi:hypothetical protein